jgi:ATP-dependent RNA helicase RhlE
VTSFHGFGLAEPIERALAEENYVTPTPIQMQTVPLGLAGRDVIGIAQTGTGKTAAFALPILHRLFSNRQPIERKSCRVLVLSPTRELSSQILDSFKAYGRHLRISTSLVIGGVSMGAQVRGLMNGVDVLVATPGRLLDLVKQNALRINKVEFLVLDEADRMLDMGFIHDIRQIVAKLPVERQTMFFSATMPQAIEQLAAQMLRNPERVAVTPEATTADRITQRIVHVDRAAKPKVLAELLTSETIERALVFTRTKHGADKVVRSLANARIAAEAIHGNKSQNQRERVLAAFRQGQVRILVATDIAARGIDVDGISHVVNYDLPNIPESYIHRIGRTARAGAEGIAISLCEGEEVAYLRQIEKLIRQSIPSVDQRTDQRASLDRPAGSRSARERHAGGHNSGQRKPHGGGPGRDARADNPRGASDQPRRRRRRKGQSSGHGGSGPHSPEPRTTTARDPVAAGPATGQHRGATHELNGVAFLQRKSDRRRPEDQHTRN